MKPQHGRCLCVICVCVCLYISLYVSVCTCALFLSVCVFVCAVTCILVLVQHVGFWRVMLIVLKIMSLGNSDSIMHYSPIIAIVLLQLTCLTLLLICSLCFLVCVSVCQLYFESGAISCDSHYLSFATNSLVGLFTFWHFCLPKYPALSSVCQPGAHIVLFM